MSKTFNSIVFDIFSTEKDAVVLRDFTHDKSAISYKRTAPKRVKDFPGMEKTELKHTFVGVDGNIIGIQTVTTSIRADATDADRVYLITTTASATDDSSYDELIKDQRLPLNLVTTA